MLSPRAERVFMRKKRLFPPLRLAAQYVYIRRYFCEPISILAMAESMGWTAAHFIGEFRRFYGTTPKDYVTALRLGRAQKLLRESELPVHLIATACGYEDQFYFYKLFRRRFGMTPTAYRERMRGKRNV